MSASPVVYFIDDSATMREVIKIAFRRENINVITCQDPASALTLMEQTSPDVVISDVIMPGKDGYEVCQFVKQHPKMNRTPVILMSGVVNRSVAERAFAVKADELIRKPFQPQDLINRVRHLLSGKPAAAPAVPPASVAAMATLSSIFQSDPSARPLSRSSLQVVPPVPRSQPAPAVALAALDAAPSPTSAIAGDAMPAFPAGDVLMPADGSDAALEADGPVNITKVFEPAPTTSAEAVSEPAVEEPVPASASASPSAAADEPLAEVFPAQAAEVVSQASPVRPAAVASGMEESKLAQPGGSDLFRVPVGVVLPESTRMRLEILRLRSQVKKLEAELAAERDYSRALEQHMKTLEEMD